MKIVLHLLNREIYDVERENCSIFRHFLENPTTPARINENRDEQGKFLQLKNFFATKKSKPSNYVLKISQCLRSIC